MFRRIFIYAVVMLVGGVLVGPALAKTSMRSCSNVTVGHYQATKVRATSNLGCKAARSDLSLWLKRPTKLPHNAKSWHAKLVKGTWQMAYGRHSTSFYFVLAKLTPPKPTPKPTPTPTPLPTQLPTPLPQPQPTSTPTPTPTSTPTSKQNQTVAFTSTAPAHPVASGFPYTAAATATSGLPVALTLDASSTGCTLSGAIVSFTGAGTCVIDADQAGNAAYNAAARLQQSLTVTQAKTVVTLTFDDGYANMMKNALPVLQKDQLHGTFYIISGAVNADSNYMTWTQLQTLYQDGNEIGSHTVFHEALPQVKTAEATQELCQDRYDLMNPPGLAPGSLGPITSLAYPDGEGIASGSPNTTDGGNIENIIKACGFNSARTVQGLDDNSFAPDLEAVPLTSTDEYDPATATTPDVPNATGTSVNDPFALMTTPSIGTATPNALTAKNVETWVGSGEKADASSNGWVSLTFHDVCTLTNQATCNGDPPGYQMDTTEFTSLMTYLVQEEEAGNIVVKTMGQVVGGTKQPAVAPTITSPANEWAALPTVTGTAATITPAVNATFTAAANGSDWYNEPDGPPCYELDQSAVIPLFTGINGTQYIKSVPVTGEPLGDANGGQIISTGVAGIITSQDLGECSPVLAPGTYTLAANFQATAGVPVFFEAFKRTATGSWLWLADGPSTVGTGAWQTMPTFSVPLPAGANGISYGLVIGGAGTLTVDDYSMTG